MLAIAAAFGTVWVVRAGIAIALVGAIVAAWLLIRQGRAAVQQAQAKAQAELRGEMQARSEERRGAQDVLETMSTYNDSLAKTNHGLQVQQREANSEIAGLKQRIGALNAELSTARGDQAALRAELAERRTELTKLTAILEEREAELWELRAIDDAAGERDAVRTIGARRYDGGQDHPTVANMAAVKAATNEPDFEDQPRVAQA